MNKSESIKELADALSKAQAEMPMVVFNATNPYYKSKYADLGAIIATSKPILAKHGLSVSQLVNGGETPLSNFCIGVTTLLMHSSGEWIESSAILPVDTDKNAAQEAGKTITYLRRYALSAILGMYADEDNDGEDGKPTQKPATQITAEEVSSHEYDFTKRPYDPPTLRAAIVAKGKKCKAATDKQRNLATILLNEYYLGDEDRRHEALLYLLGTIHIQEAHQNEVTALLNWMEIEKDSGGKYMLSEMARTELSSVTKACLNMQGQQELL